MPLPRRVLVVVNPRDGEYATSLVGGTLGALIAALPLGGLLLLVRPRDDGGFEALGWAIVALAGVAVAGMMGGAVGTAVALRRRGVPRAVATGIVYLPVAAVLLFTGSRGDEARAARTLIPTFDRRGGRRSTRALTSSGLKLRYYKHILWRVR